MAGTKETRCIIETSIILSGDAEEMGISAIPPSLALKGSIISYNGILKRGRAKNTEDMMRQWWSSARLFLGDIRDDVLRYYAFLSGQQNRKVGTEGASPFSVCVSAPFLLANTGFLSPYSDPENSLDDFLSQPTDKERIKYILSPVLLQNWVLNYASSRDVPLIFKEAFGVVTGELSSLNAGIYQKIDKSTLSLYLRERMR